MEEVMKNDKIFKKMFIYDMSDDQYFALICRKNLRQMLKILVKIFGSGEKVCTFALPFG